MLSVMKFRSVAGVSHVLSRMLRAVSAQSVSVSRQLFRMILNLDPSNYIAGFRRRNADRSPSNLQCNHFPDGFKVSHMDYRSLSPKRLHEGPSYIWGKRARRDTRLRNPIILLILCSRTLILQTSLESADNWKQTRSCSKKLRLY